MARWSGFAPAADRRLVKALHDGDDDALATLYDVYAERLYDYCMALLDDSRAAADIVHDTFIDAGRRAPRMRDRARLRPWLYAAARRRCLQRKRQIESAKGDPLGNLDFLQRETLFLVLRHGLTGDDLAATLGISVRRADSRLLRAQQRVPDADDFLNRAAAPAVPPTLRHRVQHTGTDPELAGYRVEIASRGGALTSEGMPRQPDAPSHLARRWAFTSVGLIAATATVIVAMLLIGPDLPIPSIQWPGGRPHTSTPSAPGQRPSPYEGVPGGMPPRPSTAPRLIPSAKTSSPSRAPTRGGPGTLAVSPRSIHFGPRDKTASLTLTANGGRVSWTGVTSSPQLALSMTQGTLKENDHVTIQVVLDRGLVTLPGTGTITLTDDSGDDLPVNVAWDASVL